jgi:hypothetical protein
MSEDNLDAIARREFGIETNGISEQDFAYLLRRKAELEDLPHVEKLLIAELLASEYQTTVLRREQTALLTMFMAAKTQDEMDYLAAKGDLVAAKLKDWMERYHNAANRSGLRRKPKPQPASPLSELWLRWREQQGTTDNPSETPPETEGNAE